MLYFRRGGNLNLFVTETGAVVSLRNGSMIAAARLELAGAVGHGVVSGESPTGGIANYLVGEERSDWITGARLYRAVRNSEAVPGIDLVFYSTGKQLEYDVVVKPRAKPREVRLRFAGAKKLSVLPNGDLRIETAAGDLIQRRPTAWQNSSGGRKPVEVHYRLSPTGDIGFRVGHYDPSHDLVIDPVITYSTYLGGSLAEQASAIAVDNSGNAYLAGQGYSVGFPSTLGAAGVSGASTATDVFVAKLNPSGTDLIYSTYLAGLGTNTANAIALDASGSAYIAGSITSSGTRVTGGVVPAGSVLGAGPNVFVAKLNAAGTALLYAAYLGGSTSQSASAIAVDSMGNAYIAGATASKNFPTTVGSYSTSFSGSQAAFVFKLNPAGTQLVYSTFLGGTGTDSANAIALDSLNNAYVAGFTQSPSFPVTLGAYQSAPKTGVPQNGFVAAISADGSRLNASTLLGGSANPSGSSATSISALALDSTNSPYVTGYTYSTSFPTTANVFSTALPAPAVSNPHVFVAKLNAALGALSYSTFLAGSGAETAAAIKVDAAGRAYVAGATASADFPITTGSLFAKKNPAGRQSAFLTELDARGQTLAYSTIVGGTGTDAATGVAIDANQGVYLAGYTGSSDFPVTAGAFQTASSLSTASATTAFVAKLDLSSAVTCSVSISPASYAAPLAGGASSFTVSAPAGCPWVVYSPSGAVTFNGPTGGFGNGAVNFSVPSNATSLSPVSATLSIGSATFSITQPAGSCSTPILTPGSAGFGVTGGSSQVKVALPAACPYTAIPPGPWLTVTSGSPGTGSGAISYTVDPDNFSSRSGNLVIDGVAVPVTETGVGCTASATANAGTSAAGGTGYISLSTTGTGCAWKAYSLSPWILLGASAGTGPTNLSVTLAPNPGSASRSGQVLVAGQTVSFTQSAGPAGLPSAYAVSTVAGNGAAGFSGDGGPATAAQLNNPTGLSFDASGNLFIADLGNNRVRKVALDGTISTAAGNGTLMDSGNGGSGTNAGLASPRSAVVGPAGELYIGDTYSGSVRKFAGGIMNTLATGITAISLAADSSANVYSGGNGVLQKIAPAGTVAVAAGTQGHFGFAGDGGAPAAAMFGGSIGGLALDASANLYLSDTANNRVRRISGATISTVAGTGAARFTGDGPALTSALNAPSGLALDAAGNILVADTGNLRIRRFAPAGNISTIAGSGNAYQSGATNGDGGPAGLATFGQPNGIAVDPFGNIAVSDPPNQVVRLLTPSYGFCSYSVSPLTATAPAGGIASSPTVTTSAGCVWNIFSAVPWITASTPGGSGPGMASLIVAPNAGPAARTGAVGIAGQIFTVTQSAPPTVTIEAPAVGSSGSGALTVSGWALDNAYSIGSSIASVQVLVDGTVAGNATYGLSRADICAAYPGRPGCPNVGFTYSLNTALLSGGSHTVTVNATNSATQPTTGSASVAVSVAATKPSIVSVSPVSGSGNTQVFTAVYSDTGGASVLNRRALVINSTLSSLAACGVEADTGGIYLANDGNTALLGPLSPTGTLSNSQCTVVGSQSGVVNSGNNSTATFAVNFAVPFAGPKNLYLSASDASGTSTGYVSLGTYTVLPAIAQTVTPNSGAGYSGVFTAAFTDVGGASALTRKLLILNFTASQAAACAVEIDGSQISLVNDAGTATTAASGTVSNSQCSLIGAESSVSNAGNVSTATLVLSFKSAFAGAKNIYLSATDSGGYATGTVAGGTFTVTAPPATPISMTFSPSTGSGNSQVFTAVFSDTGGFVALSRKVVIINSGLTAVGACAFEIDGNGIYLINDADSALLGPLNNTSTLSNSQCKVAGTASGVANSGLSSTVTLSIAFTAAFAGPKNVYLFSNDATGYNTGYPTLGTFTATGPPAQISASITPSSGSGLGQIFTAVLSDLSGTGALIRKVLIINSALSVPSSCSFEVDGNYIFLINDADTALLGPLTSGVTLSNSQCSVKGSASGVSNSGNTSTVALSISFTPSFAGSKNLYVFSNDTTGYNTGYLNLGSYTVLAAAPQPMPAAVSISPNSGTGANQTFIATYSDALGSGVLNRRVLIVASTLTAVGACAFEIDPAGIYLINDADSALLALPPGGGPVSNSQCSLTSASVANSGNTSTVTLSIAFKTAFSGLKNLYLYADDTYGYNTGYLNLGTYTVN